MDVLEPSLPSPRWRVSPRDGWPATCAREYACRSRTLAPASVQQHSAVVTPRAASCPAGELNRDPASEVGAPHHHLGFGELLQRESAALEPRRELELLRLCAHATGHRSSPPPPRRHHRGVQKATPQLVLRTQTRGRQGSGRAPCLPRAHSTGPAHKAKARCQTNPRINFRREATPRRPCPVLQFPARQ